MTEAASPPAGGTSPHPRPWVAPASYAQERIWFASQLTRGAAVYHVLDEIKLRYPVAAEQVIAALSLACERHEPLRTSFLVRDGELMQMVHPHVDPEVEHLDLSDLTPGEQAQRINELSSGLADTPIQLDAAPLWHGLLVYLGPADWMLLIVAHHTVFDAASTVNLRAELTELCAAAAQGRPASLPELPIRYADYSAWQRDRLEHGELDELLTFWRTELTGLPAVHGLRTDLPRPAERTFAGADLNFPLPAGTEAAVAGLAGQASATPSMVMFAAYAALLHRLSEADDIVVGMPVAGRDLPELVPLIGMFVNMIVVRLDAGGNPSFTELLVRARLALFDAWDHQEMPFQKLVEVVGHRRDTGVAPLYQLGFNYLSSNVGFAQSTGAAEDDLVLEISGGFGRLQYNTALFTEQTARRIAEGYQQVLSAVTADPSVRMTGLPVEPLAQEIPADQQPAVGKPPHIPPRSAAEELVAGVWSDVLGTSQPGALDDFFDLGGHSLLALRVIARLSAATGTDVTIQSFFADTTVAGVAAELERLLAAELAGMSEDEAARLVAGEG